MCKNKCSREAAGATAASGNGAAAASGNGAATACGSLRRTS